MRRAVGIAVMVVVVGLEIGCGGEPGPPNILVVVLDTLRADATGLHTSATPDALRAVHLTPNLHALASQGVTFSDCTSVAPWTVPAHASMFTGRLPGGHRCVAGNLRLNPELPTFADQLRGSGYDTAAFFSNPWLADRTTGVLRGFSQRFEARLPMRSWKRGREGGQGGIESVGALRSWLADRDGSRPFLAFVNLLESHLAYDPPPEYRGVHLLDLPSRDTVDIQWSQRYLAGLVDRDAVDWHRVARLYAGDVWRADRLLGHVTESLRLAGLEENTVVIVTSDHGEHLGEHGLVEHQFSLFEPLLRVPMVVVVPERFRRRFDPGGADGSVRDDPVQTIDLYATVVHLGGMESSMAAPFSRSLLGMPMGSRRPVYAQYAGPMHGLLQRFRSLNPAANLTRFETSLVSVRVGHLRLIVDGRGRSRLFDLREDPGQRNDLASERFADLEDLCALVRRLPTLPDSGDPASFVDIDTQDRLRALGYIP